MDKQITVGKEVTLSSAFGLITRTVAEVHENVVAVCTPEEYRRAKTEHRQPAVVGFKISDIVDTA